MEWPELLDDMQRRLDGVGAMLREGAAPPPPFAEPGPMPPLPPELAPRAEAILTATEAARRQVAEAHAALGAALRRAADGRPRRPAAYVDVRA